MTIEDQIKAVVNDQIVILIGCTEAVAIKENAEGFGEAAVPILFRHLGAVGFEPGDVIEAGLTDGLSFEPIFSGEGGVAFSELDKVAGEFEEVLIGVGPIDP